MAVTLRIEFDRPDAVYLAGELVTGRVCLHVTKPKRVTVKFPADFSIQLKGAADVRWNKSVTRSSGAGSSSREIKRYSATENYFVNKVCFVGGGTGEVDVCPGDHEYPFECQLPGVAPSSFEGVHGGVRYTAKATLYRPWNVDHTVRAAFTVISPLDLNDGWPQAKEPVRRKETKNFSGGASGGPLSIDVHLPTGGYVPGQAIRGEILIENGSDRLVRHVLFALEKEVTWRSSRGMSQVTRASVAAAMFDGGVDKQSSKAISLVMPVPAVPPSNLEHCGLIDLQYFVKVTAEVAGSHRGLQCDVPVLVGTVPVLVRDGTQESASAPHGPPPTYGSDQFEPDLRPLIPRVPPPVTRHPLAVIAIADDDKAFPPVRGSRPRRAEGPRTRAVIGEALRDSLPSVTPVTSRQRSGAAASQPATNLTMAVTLRIEFDRPDAVYFAGELVTGRVCLHVTKPKRVTGFSIQLRGVANVRWTERTSRSRRRGSHSETYSASETYFDNKVFLLGGTTGEVEISPGDHVYNFECLLPSVVPSSFEGHHGSIRYTATAAMHRPWKFDHTAKTAFTVISHLDLNSRLQAREPVSSGATKHFYCGLCRSGPLSVDVHLPSGGYVPGQAILGQIQVDNGSGKQAQRVLCSLEKEVTWHSNRGRTKVTRTPVTATMFDGAVQTHSSKVISLVMPVPAVPPSNLEHCSIIDLQYFLKVTVEVPGFHLNLHCDVPILVGTIPAFVQDGWNRTNMAGPSLETPSAPPPASPPPMYQSELPPPSYEESVLKGNNIMDPTDTYTMGQADFTPRYPVWAFSNPSFEKY
ncbi:uncharacterized protein LOC117638914 [Thrips palmi]|uniref:Uncharacterized protein LOC117638914 n=1 Tax=Thrips palmi TaxID=161013 RepID=A0A6P8Y1A6_THRPL|nr:uncharacterized protein LOC117638914 [Thrips palmi]